LPVYHRYDQARTEIDRAIAINPNVPMVSPGVAMSMWSGQTDAAIADLELASRTNPVDRFSLSHSHLKGRYDEAIEQCELNLRKPRREFQPHRIAAAATGKLTTQRGSTTIPLDPTFDARIQDQVSEFGRSNFARRIVRAGLWTDEASRAVER
jgi:hypothetical protein